MIVIPGVKGKSFGVFGLGVSGIATCEALSAAGANVFSWDENAKAREKTANSVYLAEHPKSWPWNKLAALVVSPGVPLNFPKPHAIVRKARFEKIPVYGDTELFAQAVNAVPEAERPNVIAVTGSNGKSTTTALIGHILKEAGKDVCVGGNIGEAVLSLPAISNNLFYVLELSSFQLDLTHSLRADAAAFLNLSPDHIERHGDMNGYLAAKMRIFNNQTAEDIAVVGVDDEHMEGACTHLIAHHKAKVIPVSAKGALGSGVFALNGRLHYNFDGKTTLAGDLREAHGLPGAHNHQNAAVAVAVASFFGVSPAVAVKAAQRFESLPHRMEEVARLGRVAFVNDSKATNASAAARALGAYKDVFLIAGGRAKDGGAKALRDCMSNVRKVYLIGEAAGAFEEDLRGAAPCVQCGELSNAIEQAKKDALACDAPAPVVLLSPACASYDQFANFEARGDEFRKLACALAARNGEAA